LILAHGRLYLARYQAYERHLATQLLQRAADLPEVDEVNSSESLTGLFALTSNSPTGNVCCRAAVRRKLTVISGGPAPAKPPPVRLLAALLSSGAAIRLVARTWYSGLAAPYRQGRRTAWLRRSAMPKPGWSVRQSKAVRWMRQPCTACWQLWH
jgi:exodeoxyribonuclease V alpha subunit